MKTTPNNRQLWIEFTILAGISALFATLLNRIFARYKPVKGPPEEKPGDTPASPWNIPDPEEKAKAEPVRRTIEQTTAQIDTPEKANRTAEQMEKLAGNVTDGEVEDSQKPNQPGNVSEKVADASRHIVQAAGSASIHNAPPEEKAARAITQTAKEVTTSRGREREALAEATQETLNPEQQGAPVAAHPRQRQYLRQAVLKRMTPWDAVDAEVFLAVNHLPHNRWLNRFFFFFTFTFSAGLGWYAVLTGLAFSGNRRKGLQAASQMILPLSMASALVEYPIKTFFRRRRPFINNIQAIVIGKKPGSWSFPSGHSAGAFAGASLLSRDYPRQRPFLYLIAALVAFSRIYLGDHYPGDVISGSLSGILIADTVRRAQDTIMKDM